MSYCTKCGQKKSFLGIHICTASNRTERVFCSKCGTMISRAKWHSDYRGSGLTACPKCYPDKAEWFED